jgi:hypothetical protein
MFFSLSPGNSISFQFPFFLLLAFPGPTSGLLSWCFTCDQSALLLSYQDHHQPYYADRPFGPTCSRRMISQPNLEHDKYLAVAEICASAVGLGGCSRSQMSRSGAWFWLGMWIWSHSKSLWRNWQAVSSQWWSMNTMSMFSYFIVPRAAESRV